MAKADDLPMNRDRQVGEESTAEQLEVPSEDAPEKLTVGRILAWADAYHGVHRRWPGRITGEFWRTVDRALVLGMWGLPGDSSLAEVLAEHRSVGPRSMHSEASARKIPAVDRERASGNRPRECADGRKGQRPSLTIDQVLAWADAYHAAHGFWPGPTSESGEARSGYTWRAIDLALRLGWFGLPGGTTLGGLLVQHRGPEAAVFPDLTVEQILAWADTHHAVTGQWPKSSGGAVAEAPHETWLKINTALQQGRRGLPGGTTLARVLARHRGVRNRRDPPQLTMEQILAWADAHHSATGRWPWASRSPIAAAPGETWYNINNALARGSRGLPGGVTLSQILAERKPPKPPPLTVEQIRAWARAHRKATGAWPKFSSGPVTGVPGETWYNINRALCCGERGLPCALSLAKVIGRPRKRIAPPKPGS